MMKKIFLMMGLFLVSLTACQAQSSSDDKPEKDYPRLNEISLTLSAEDWVVTQTAKVVIGVDANLDQSGLEKLQNQVMDGLKVLAKNGDWRITQHLRNADQSGLESVHIEAEARLPESQLSSLREQAKAMSKPGFKYTVLDMQYTPTLLEIEKVREGLRKTLYDRVSAELNLLNKTYSGQNYYVHQIDFNMGDVAPPMPMMMAKVSRSDVGANASVPESTMPASQKLTLVANVVISSTIQKPK